MFIKRQRIVEPGNEFRVRTLEDNFFQALQHRQPHPTICVRKTTDQRKCICNMSFAGGVDVFAKADRRRPKEFERDFHEAFRESRTGGRKIELVSAEMQHFPR